MLLWIQTAAKVCVFNLLKGSLLPEGMLIFSVPSTSKKIDFYMLLSATVLFLLSLQMPFGFIQKQQSNNIKTPIPVMALKCNPRGNTGCVFTTHFLGFI